MTADTPNISGASSEPSFVALYAEQAREAIRMLAREALASGAEAEAQARHYAARGKPDFALAYLLESALADDEKRAIYADAFERRAALTEGKAREFDAKFHRPFPLLASDAAQDRGRARQVREGKRMGKGAGKQLPLI
ncbi:MAG TPA: hypothetical protein VFN78_03175 [Ktedonobacterales bacterium]|nr:hypothetical protein [Ktedonobacterales bacterium]